MNLFMKSVLFAAAVVAAPMLAAAPAQAVPLVTYTWTTTSQGFGPHLSQPTSASFQAPLSDVLAGEILQFDISNIQLAYPGLTFDSYVASSIGFDFGIFVDPVTGNLIFHDNDQGLAVIGQDTSDPNFSTFLSITVGNPVGGVVKDQFNALDHGSPAAGFPTAGFWTASLPAGGGVPEPASWALMITGLAAVGAIVRRRRAASAIA